MSVEYELKFRATEAALAAMDAAFSVAAVPYKMETTYYDTPDRALSARHITLRRRLENETSVCTLKAPAEEGRLEFELNCDNILTAIPELCKLANIPELPALLEKGVEPVCSARFMRKARSIPFIGSTLELALDQGVLIGGGKEQPFCEAEVELKAGDPRHANLYAAQLAATYSLKPEADSKFKRAYRLSQEA